MSNSNLQSMTGYADASGRHESADWQWQIKSVNGKGLDVRLRMPSGFEALEASVRKQFAQKFKRGNMQVSLSLDRDKNGGVPTINEAALDAVIKAAMQVSKRIDIPLQSVEGLLSQRGVLEIADAKISDEEQAELNKAVMVGLDEVLNALAISRSGEGTALGRVLLTIEVLTKTAEDNPARSVEAIRARLGEQVALLIEGTPVVLMRTGCIRKLHFLPPRQISVKKSTACLPMWRRSENC